MKNTFFLLLFLLPLPALRAQDYGDTLVLFEKKQVVYLLGDSINVRQTPGTNGAVVARLPIGTPVTILEKSREASRINNILMPWYLVEFNGKQKGYIWGGKLALNSFRSNKNPDIVFHFGIDKRGSEEGAYAQFQIRVEKEHKELQRLNFEAFGTEYKRHVCSNISNKGLSGVDDILQVDGYGEFCGDDSGTLVFFWTGTELIYVDRLFDLADGAYFARQTFVYPSDMEGEKETVIKKEQVGEILFEEEQHVTTWDSDNVAYEKNEAQRLRWDGKKLVPRR